MPRAPQVVGVMCQEEGGESERLSFGWWPVSGFVRQEFSLRGGQPSQRASLWEVVRKGADATN